MNTFVKGVDANRFRRRRFERLLGPWERIAAEQGTIRVCDVGGTTGYWNGMRDLWSHLPVDITIVNLGVEPRREGCFNIVAGNACDLSEYGDRSFDFVHSNSVIEHVGHWPEMMAMAREVRRIAPRYYVQTPNFWFPMEPHYRTLFFHWYPEQVRARMLMRKRRGFRGPHRDVDHAMRDLQTAVLLDAKQLSALFPDAQISRERIAGLTKSIIAERLD